MPLQIMKLSRVRRMGMMGVVGGGMEASMDAAEEESNAPVVSETWRAEEVMAASGGCDGARVLGGWARRRLEQGSDTKFD
jgi:hypothetical protein